MCFKEPPGDPVYPQLGDGQPCDGHAKDGRHWHCKSCLVLHCARNSRTCTVCRRPIEQMMTDDDAIEEFVRKAAVGVWHASCTCRMGTDDDPMAVTDNTGRVRGVDGLRVVDASIFPVVPCANTNFPTLMTAEKISDAILSGQ